MRHREQQLRRPGVLAEDDTLVLDKQTVKDLEPTATDASAARGGLGVVTHSCIILCDLTK